MFALYFRRGHDVRPKSKAAFWAKVVVSAVDTRYHGVTASFAPNCYTRPPRRLHISTYKNVGGQGPGDDLQTLPTTLNYAESYCYMTNDNDNSV
jgi:hypothetical protein